jgi:Ca-activated chloride channel homolog
MLLRDSPYKAGSSWASLIERARSAKGLDFEGYRAEFVRLAELAQTLAAK